MTFALILRRAIDWFYRRPFSRVISETVFRYGACGAITLSVDAVSYALIYHFLVAGRYFDLGFVVMSPHIASLVLVFPITFFTGFWLNRYVAFRTLPVAAGKQLGRYLLTVVGSILLNYACMKFLVEVCGLWPTPSKCITSLAVALYSYLAARYYTFKGIYPEKSGLQTPENCEQRQLRAKCRRARPINRVQIPSIFPDKFP